MSVASLQDEKLRDRYYQFSQRGTMVYLLPVRKVYRIETTFGMGMACKKALSLAASDGIGAAIVKTALLLGGNDELFFGITGEDRDA